MTPDAFFPTVFDPTTWSEDTKARLLALKADTKLAPTSLSEDPELASITIYPGDLHVKADFSFNSHTLVLGDLVVDGIINGDPAHAILMVAGNVRCKTLAMVRVYLLVTGNVEARACVYATAYGKSMVAGRIVTHLFAHSAWDNVDFEGKATEANIEAALRVDLDAREAKSQLRKALKPEALPKKKNAGVWDMMEAVVGGDEVFV